MKRVLEPEVMDTAEDAAEYDAMDFAAPNGRFAEDALALLGERPGAEVLDVGTGTADIPVRMLRRDARLRVVGVDLAGEMLRLAARKVADAGLSAQCSLERVDGKALPFDAGRFDMVMCNSAVHHVPEPIALLRELARVVRPGGAVIVRDLIRPETTEEAWATVERVAAGDGPRQKQLFFDSLCAALTLEEVAALAREAGLGDARVARVSDRHWTLERPRSA